jgi:hypothetical protein
MGQDTIPLDAERHGDLPEEMFLKRAVTQQPARRGHGDQLRHHEDALRRHRATGWTTPT